MTTARPVILCVLDGWGERAERDNNAIALASTPVWDRFAEAYPRAQLDESIGPAGRVDGEAESTCRYGRIRQCVSNEPSGVNRWPTVRMEEPEDVPAGESRAAVLLDRPPPRATGDANAGKRGRALDGLVTNAGVRDDDLERPLVVGESVQAPFDGCGLLPGRNDDADQRSLRNRAAPSNAARRG